MRQTSLNMVHELAKVDPRVLFIGSDLGDGTLKAMRAEVPERWFMEGVAEQHLIGMAAGLAMEGFVPYLNTIATFLTRRCLEQIAVDVCLHKLPVRLIASGGGLVYAPLGPTHLAIEDVALMRALPNMAVVCPSDASEMRRFMAASLNWPGPIYIRLGKGGDPVISRDEDEFCIGRGLWRRRGTDIVLVSTGIMTGRCLAAAEILRSGGLDCSVLHLHTVKPLDVETLLEAAARHALMVTVEEHVLIGGLGSAVAELLADHGASKPLMRLGLPDAFPGNYGTQDEMLELYGLTPAGIAASVRRAAA
jgi:transketolase